MLLLRLVCLRASFQWLEQALWSTRLSSFSAPRLARVCLGWCEEGRSNISILETSFSVSHSSKMAIYELVVLGNLYEMTREANGLRAWLCIFWEEWELFPSPLGAPGGRDHSEWGNLSVLERTTFLCMLTVLLFIFNELTRFFCFCFPFLIYPCVFINGFSLPCLPLSVGF